MAAPSSLDEVDNRINRANFALRREQLDRIASQGLDAMNKTRVTYRIAGHEYTLQDQVASTASFLLDIKSWADTALQASPQAAIAWAVICMGLPLVTRPIEANRANRDGFVYITSRMRYYTALETLILDQISEPAVKEELENHIVELYGSILEFLIKSVLRFFRSKLKN